MASVASQETILVALSGARDRLKTIAWQLLQQRESVSELTAMAVKAGCTPEAIEQASDIGPLKDEL